MSLDVLLKILGTLESLATEIAFVRLQGHVNSNVRGNVVTLYSCGAAVAPLASEIQVVRALTSNMAFADVILDKSVCWSRGRQLRVAA